jgi:hypothetical protein
MRKRTIVLLESMETEDLFFCREIYRREDIQYIEYCRRAMLKKYNADITAVWGDKTFPNKDKIIALIKGL